MAEEFVIAENTAVEMVAEIEAMKQTFEQKQGGKVVTGPDYAKNLAKSMKHLEEIRIKEMKEGEEELNEWWQQHKDAELAEGSDWMKEEAKKSA